MNDYKATLNLPKTAFPMKANLPQREPAMLKKWQADGLYAQLRASRQGQAKFIVADGPPYANGHIHCGHALNKILKDIIVKAKNLSGFDAPFVPGWDCHGLPIELNVEKKFGKAGVKISAQQFRQKCREYAQSQIEIQREEFQRLGVLGDWHQPYITMDYTYEANIIRTLGQVIAAGHLQQGFKPVYWCIDCRSALAEAEVEYENKTSPAIDVRFRVVDEAKFLACLQPTENGLGQGELSVPIWTTTPWTLPANQAVALNGELTYALVEFQREENYQRVLLAQDLVASVMTRYAINDYRIVAHAQGQQLEGLSLQHPLFDRQVPIILGAHVTTEAGTGNVHTAPAHGVDDYHVSQKYNLPIDNPVNDYGCYYDDVPHFAGQRVFKANQTVIELLTAKDNLFHLADFAHSYPHCWRHKTPVIFRATPQWFIAMDKQQLREAVLKQIKQVDWIPEWGEERITKMVANRPDWCISRQRSWGTPITLFVHKQTRELHPDTQNLLEQIAERVAARGIDAWFELAVDEMLSAEDAPNYEKVTDTLDVWFDSGVYHYAVLQQRADLAFPADLYLEGSDQHRGWFNSSITTSVAMYQQAPFKSVLTHGFTVDAKGHKLSKSKGNYIELDKLVKTTGADILRLWVASVDYRHEQPISDEILKRIGDTYRRIRNTCRFLLANLFDFIPAQHNVAEVNLLAIDRWAIGRAQQLQQHIMAAYADYQFHNIYQAIQHFCAIDMGSFYLDIIKDRQYTTPTDSVARRSCQTAMQHIAETLVRCMAPILSFTAEELWEHLPGERTSSVFLSDWYTGFPELHAEKVSDAFWTQIISVRDAINKAIETQRNNGAIGSALEAEVDLYCSPELQSQLLPLDDELRFIFITSAAKVSAVNAKPSTAVATEIDGLYLDIKASAYAKCTRCWHRRADVGQHAAHPELCGRCVENISGAGEIRLYA